MDRDLQLYREATRKGLYGSVVFALLLAGLLVWNARGLDQVDTDIAQAIDKLDSLQEQKLALSETLRSLVDAEGGGVRAVAQRVDVSAVVHDFFLWVDVRDLSGEVVEVRYEFEHSAYDPITTSLAATGFAAYFRGPVRDDQPICPGRTKVIISLAEGPAKLIDFDLCGAVGLGVAEPAPS